MPRGKSYLFFVSFHPAWCLDSMQHRSREEYSQSARRAPYKSVSIHPKYAFCPCRKIMTQLHCVHKAEWEWSIDHRLWLHTDWSVSTEHRVSVLRRDSASHFRAASPRCILPMSRELGSWCRQSFRLSTMTQKHLSVQATCMCIVRVYGWPREVYIQAPWNGCPGAFDWRKSNRQKTGRASWSHDIPRSVSGLGLVYYQMTSRPSPPEGKKKV